MTQGFRASPDGIPEIRKSPDAELDYSLDWTEWLETGETLSSASWTVPDGILGANEAITGSLTTIWLSGGTVDADYVIASTIVTSQDRTETRSFRILCRTR